MSAFFRRRPVIREDCPGRQQLEYHQANLMFFRKTEKIQKLNLDDPSVANAGPAPLSATVTTSAVGVDPARLEAIRQKAKHLLDSGRVGDSLFVCRIPAGLLVLGGAGERVPVMLLFSSPFAASDYLRATKTAGSAGQVKFEDMPKSAQSWVSSGVHNAIIDRCPRCSEALSFELAAMAKWTPADFAKVLAHHRATRLLCGETRIRSAMKHLSARSHAEALRDLEYVRDHFDCSVPYLHQVIGLLAGINGDETVKAGCVERLKEFGPPFAGPLEFSIELMASSMVGLTASFGMVLESTEKRA